MKKMILIVPYRDREAHLKQFIPIMEKELIAQNINFEILVVEQSSKKLFNRAKLLNIGVDYYLVNKIHFDYICFHDVDMIPVETDYEYCDNPTHLAARAEQFNWQLPYNGYFGGVTLFDKDSFLKINGYSNKYFGWGAEDDDIFNRCLSMGIKTSRKNCSYQSLDHERIIDKHAYAKNLDILSKFNSHEIMLDGLNTLEYDIIECTKHSQYTKIIVDL